MPDQLITDWRSGIGDTVSPCPPGGPVTPMWRAVARGACNRCPGCGDGRIFSGFLRVDHPCLRCATPLDQVRADDAPPYFTVLIAGHLIIPCMLVVDRMFAPALWVSAAIWLPTTCALTVGLLRPVKGAVIAVMLKLNMIRPGDAA